MKLNIPPGVVIAVIVVVVAGVLYFGWQAVTGGPNADITQASIKRYQAMKTQAEQHKFTSPAEAAKAGAPMSAGPGMGRAAGAAPPMGSTAPMGSGAR